MDWKAEKSRLIEVLFAYTENLRLALERGDWDSLDQILHERAKVFLQLIRIDRAHQSEVTEHDALWLKQLQEIKRSGDEVYAKIRVELARLAEEFRADDEARKQIFQEEMISPKGSRIERRA